MQLLSLKSKKEFQAIFAEDVKFITSSFVVYIYKNENNADLRYGLIASKKQFPTAVERNFAKRRLRSILTLIHQEAQAPALDMIIIARKNILKSNFAYMQKSMKKLIKSV